MAAPNPLEFPIENLYQPGMPARMASSPPGASLQRGEWQLLQNLRVGNRALKTRLGMARVGSSPATETPTDIRAAKTVTLNGTEYPIAIYRNSGGTAIIAAWYNTASGVWTEITAASGKYGSTRWSASSSDFYCIEKVSDPQSQKEYVVMSGLNQSPRVWDGTNCAIHTEVTPPSSSAIYSIVPTFPKYFDVQDDGANSLSNSSGNFAASDVGSDPAHYFLITRNSTATSNPTVTLTFTASVDLSACPQLILIYDSAHLAWWEHVKVEISDSGAGYSTVWDPQDQSYTKDVAPAAVPNKYAVAFPLNHIVAASRDAVTIVRFTWAGAAPSSTKTLSLYAVCGSGLVRGERIHAISYLNSGSRAESIGLVYGQDKIIPATVFSLSGPNVDGLRIPHSAKLMYDYKVNFQNPVTAQKDAGVDTLLLWANDYGEDSGYYTYVTSVSLATADSPFTAWSYASGTTGSIRTYTDTTPVEDKNLSIYAPDESHLPIPTNCTMLAAGSGRLFAGRYWNGSTFVSELWFSQLDHPFRFRQDARFFAENDIDETSPSSIKFPGEILMGMTPSQTERLDVAGIYVVSDSWLSGLSGTTTSQLSYARHLHPFGTYYPKTICEDGRGRIIYVDTTGNVQAFGYGEDSNISRATIEGHISTLQGRGGEFQLAACFFNNRYYLSYDTVGSTAPETIRKTKSLVWDSEFNAWVVDDPAGTITVEHWLPSKNKLYVLGFDGYLYEYEKSGQTTDQGSAFTTTLTGRVLHDEMWNPIFVKRMGIVCEDGASSTWTTTRTNFKDSTTSTGTINTDVSTTQAYRWDDATPKPGMRAVGVELKWSSSTYPGGKSIFSLPAEVRGTLWHGADVA